MEPTEFISKDLVKMLSEALDSSEASGSKLWETLQTWKSADGAPTMVCAVAQGLGALLKYAEQPMNVEHLALDAEREAVEVSRTVVLAVFEAKLQRRMEALDQERHGGGTTCPRCDKRAESQGKRSRSWCSLLGKLTLRRRYSFCAACRRGLSPAQDVLGLPAGDFTGRLEEVCTMMATTVPYGMATTVMEKICGINISTKAMEDMTDRRGNQFLALDSEEASRCDPFDEIGLPTPSQAQPEQGFAEQTPPSGVAYVEIDGVIPITREELTGTDLTSKDRERQAQAKLDKSRGGKGRRYQIVGREVKNAVLYDGEQCAQESASRGSILEKTYVSYLGGWTAFALRLWVTMLRLRFNQAKKVVILSDGAKWIVSLAKWLPVETFLILDFYHVSHRIWEVANIVYGDKTQAGAVWAREQCARIEAGRSVDVVRAIRFLKPKNKNARKKVKDLVGYLTDNRKRMNYPAYREEGLRVTSAAVESANFHVTGTRLKLQGMRWSHAGAKRMAALRADLFNGNWEATTRHLLAA